MNTLKNKIDFAVIVTVDHANPNGDPLNGNRPRTTYAGNGEISDVCIKRKIRNRLQDMGEKIFVQSNDRCNDGYDSLRARADATITDYKSTDEYAQKACKEWIDVRSFGQVFAYKGKAKGEGVSVGVRGPVSIHQAISVGPIDVNSMQITKSVSGESGDKNVQLAEKTGFTQEDAEKIKECLRTLFINDSSSARPDGSMEVVKVYWWKHNNEIGQYSSAKVHKSLEISLKDDVAFPASIDDFVIQVNPLEGLEPEIINGI